MSAGQVQATFEEYIESLGFFLIDKSSIEAIRPHWNAGRASMEAENAALREALTAGRRYAQEALDAFDCYEHRGGNAPRTRKALAQAKSALGVGQKAE